MRSERVLVTGGAGFIGSAQVHGPDAEKPAYLHADAEFVRGDVRDRDGLARALRGVDVVYHLAAAVGVGQSMYQIQYYTEANTLGGAVLLDLLANTKHNVRKMVVASSMSVYGEGKYGCGACGAVTPRLRTVAQLEARVWEMKCPVCHRDVEPLPTDEDKPLYPTSIYAITKRDHEEMFLSTGFAYDIPVVALRFFNTYGPRQALSNPYTGVMAVFCGRLLNHEPPVIYEDGRQSRDFIHVRDIVQGLLLAMDRAEADYQVVNLGTGVPTTIAGVAQLLARSLTDGRVRPVIRHQFRAGDIRHCYADVMKARRLLGFEPRVPLEEGLQDLLAWVREQQAEDGFARVEEELASKALVR
jgi:dTDP-L-rhamnose 4-epimerase